MRLFGLNDLSRYFPPKYISGLGTLQDGGVLRNNPTLIGLSEFSMVTEDAKPDFVINLGTGSSPNVAIRNERRGGSWRDGWLLRLVWAYLSLLGGQRTWNDVACLVKEPRQNGHYRLDVTLKGKFHLDDTASMPLLKSLVLRDSILHDTIQELAQRLFAALFYFELISIPTPLGSQYLVRGQVLCTRKIGDRALPLILQRLDGSMLSVDGKAIPFKVAQRSDVNITCTLTFVADRSFRLELNKARSNLSFPLSGSPYTIPTLVSRGGLEASFGTRAHKRKAECELAGSQVRRRRVS